MSGSTPKAVATGLQPSHEGIRTALDAVLSSEIFSSSPRLQQFLRYVVEEAIAGRSGQIKSKTIAVDVYRRELATDSGAQNLVRVEARRLRRLLSDYYETEGNSDPLQIQIASGGYVPSFASPETNLSPGEVLDEPVNGLHRRNWYLPVITATLVILAIGGILFAQQVENRPTGNNPEEIAIREALRDKSVPTLQASNLAQQARGLLFPVFDAERQRLALEMFRYVIRLDPEIPQGYAGATQTLSTLAFTSVDEAAAGAFSAEARALADRALAFDPSNAWAHGAKGWTLATTGELQEALQHARLALELAPEDGHVLDLVCMVGIVAREPALAALASDPQRPRSGAGRFGARNLWGVAQYMLGDYDATIKAFTGAASEGDPVSPPSLMFLAIAHDHLGHGEQARELVRELSETWPGFPVKLIVRRIFHKDSEYERDILQRLDKLGFVFSS